MHTWYRVSNTQSGGVKGLNARPYSPSNILWLAHLCSFLIVSSELETVKKQWTRDMKREKRKAKVKENEQRSANKSKSQKRKMNAKMRLKAGTQGFADDIDFNLLVLLDKVTSVCSFVLAFSFCRRPLMVVFKTKTLLESSSKLLSELLYHRKVRELLGSLTKTRTHAIYTQTKVMRSTVESSFVLLVCGIDECKFLNTLHGIPLQLRLLNTLNRNIRQKNHWEPSALSKTLCGCKPPYNLAKELRKAKTRINEQCFFFNLCTKVLVTYARRREVFIIEIVVILCVLYKLQPFPACIWSSNNSRNMRRWRCSHET